MNDKEYKQQKQRVRKLIKKWVKPLGLGWWTLDFCYNREAKSPYEKSAYSPKLVNDKWIVLMDTSADPFYKKAVITTYVPNIVPLDDDELEETFVHELMHIFLSPMKNSKYANEEEYIAQNLAQAFIWSCATKS